MFIYNLQPRVPIDVKMQHHEVESIQTVLREMKEMLHIAQDNVKNAQN